jgi:hypothetical protein
MVLFVLGTLRHTVGATVGLLNGAFVDCFVGLLVVGFTVCEFIGDVEGLFVGDLVGVEEGLFVGAPCKVKAIRLCSDTSPERRVNISNMQAHSFTRASNWGASRRHRSTPRWGFSWIGSGFDRRSS